MSLEALPDLCVLVIFDKIPLVELLRTVNLVCKRWHSLQPPACARRHSLILVYDKEAIDLNESSKYFVGDLIKHVVDESGNQIEKSPINSGLNVLVFRYLEQKSCEKLVELFPNMKSIYISHRGLWRLKWVSYLLDNWSNSLVTLKLFWGEPQLDFINIPNEATVHQLITKGFEWLFNSINSLKAIKHFKLGLAVSVWFTSKDTLMPLTFPIIAQLETLDLDAYSQMGQFIRQGKDINLGFDSLKQHGNDNRDLRQVVYRNFAKLGSLLSLNRNFCSKFTKVSIENDITSERIGQFNKFCVKFSLLTDLTLRVGAISMAQLANHLPQLCHLFHLNLYINFSPLEQDHLPLMVPNEVEQDQLSEVNSVKVLTLNITTISHSNIATLNLHTIFPNVQIVRLNYRPLSCQECGYDNMIDPFWADINPETRAQKEIEYHAIRAPCYMQARLLIKKFSKLRCLRAETGEVRGMSGNKTEDFTPDEL